MTVTQCVPPSIYRRPFFQRFSNYYDSFVRITMKVILKGLGPSRGSPASHPSVLDGQSTGVIGFCGPEMLGWTIEKSWASFVVHADVYFLINTSLSRLPLIRPGMV